MAEKNEWVEKKQGDLYAECARQKHDLRVLFTRIDSIVVYCVDCDLVWKLVYVTKTAKLEACEVSLIKTEGLLRGVEEIKGRIGKS